MADVPQAGCSLPCGQIPEIVPVALLPWDIICYDLEDCGCGRSGGLNSFPRVAPGEVGHREA